MLQPLGFSFHRDSIGSVTYADSLIISSFDEVPGQESLHLTDVHMSEWNRIPAARFNTWWKD